MSSLDPQKPESVKRMWFEEKKCHPNTSLYLHDENRILRSSSNAKSLQMALSGDFNDDQVASVVPPVTVVLEGRSICQRISLHKHSSYQSLATALRQMFVDIIAPGDPSSDRDVGLFDLSNAIPGHLIAYEDIENDLLLVGDLKWKDFVRVAKRIRILPAKAKPGKQQRERALFDEINCTSDIFSS